MCGWTRPGLWSTGRRSVPVGRPRVFAPRRTAVFPTDVRPFDRRVSVSTSVDVEYGCSPVLPVNSVVNGCTE